MLKYQWIVLNSKCTFNVCTFVGIIYLIFRYCTDKNIINISEYASFDREIYLDICPTT